jgi:hypothetical protein
MYGRPFGSIFLVQITIHFWSMEGHLGQDSWCKLLFTSGKVFVMPKTKITTKQNPQKQTNFVKTEQNVLFNTIYMTTVPL